MRPNEKILNKIVQTLDSIFFVVNTLRTDRFYKDSTEYLNTVFDNLKSIHIENLIKNIDLLKADVKAQSESNEKVAEVNNEN